MRRISDIRKVVGFIISNFKSSEYEVSWVSDDSVDLVVPYFPSVIVSLVSSDIRIGVFPKTADSVLVNIYKL